MKVRRIRFAIWLWCLTPLHAAFLPTLHLDDKAIETFNAYVAQFEKEVIAPYADSGKMWLDSSACCARGGAFASGKPVVEARRNEDIAGGSIHHHTGSMHLRNGTIEDVHRIMRDYPNYPKFFRPDVSKGSGTREPDSTPADERYTGRLTLAESTLWFNVQFDCVYDTHYRRLDERRWLSKSASVSIKELRDPKKPEAGSYPEGDDHGFLWRTNTYWLVRQTGDGIDLEADSVTLSRPNVSGFAWWGAKRSHDAVEKMLHDTKAAVEALH